MFHQWCGFSHSTLGDVWFHIEHPPSPILIVRERSRIRKSCQIHRLHVYSLGGLTARKIHPRKLTWNLKRMVSKRNLLFQGSVFRFHGSFQGSIWKSAILKGKDYLPVRYIFFQWRAVKLWSVNYIAQWIDIIDTCIYVQIYIGFPSSSNRGKWRFIGPPSRIIIILVVTITSGSWESPRYISYIPPTQDAIMGSAT